MLRQLPNLLTLLRLALTVPIALLLLAERHSQALVLFVVAGCSDALDGFLARRFNWTSKLGSIIDPLADKLLLITSYLCLTVTQLLPWWLTLVVLLRDLLIVGGASAYRLLVGPFDFHPSLLGKFSTLLQMLLVLGVLVQSSLLPGLAWLIQPLILTVLLVSLASGLQYIWVWTRKYQSARLQG